ncbi:DUF3108 domain-containing protein [Geomonas sp. Red875]|uniref:DUF3108 domain-containing protein n=2 Tax=Geomesophilobacter sediminis TaxID=2798584 RepID=A0A8J7IZ82_9BACT|nr:DUF3108 domain-containing protein [Geomesophilobacter sediminis]
MKTKALIASLVLFSLSGGTSAFALGGAEKFVYDVHWGAIKAGIAVQEVTPQGDELRIVNTIRSNGFVSTFFSIDDRQESIMSREENRFGLPRLFKENIKEGKYRARKEARFNHANLTAESTDLLHQTEKADPITARTYDSLSSIYFIRSCDLEPRRSITFDLYDFKHLWKTEVRVIKREEVKTPLGKFKTVMVTSQLRSNGSTSKVGNTTFWFTDDSRRIPVKIATQLKVGEVTLTLVGGNFDKEG